MNWKIALALAVVLAAGGLGWYLQREIPEQPQAVSVPPAPAAVERSAPPAAEPETPRPPRPERKLDPTPLIAAPTALDNSDGQVRAAVTEFAPRLVQWLDAEEQLRKWVMLIDQIATGKWPMRDRPLALPIPAFAAREEKGRLYVDTKNYARTDALVEIVTSISPARLAQYYHAWRPVLDRAYAELGGGGGFDKRLRQAIARVLQVKLLTTTPELVRPAVYYKYADERLEHASEVEKLVWRLGPENGRRVQAYLRELEQEL